ncbi:MAG: hypothetical protein F6J93_35445 [Oscillatoria sp. SIO1A7]|nr:hypothetical protein [Oscillatoria sp. SIO1A7]
MKKPLFVSLLVLLMSGLGKAPPSLPVRAEPIFAIAQNELATKPELELLDAGIEPRQKLRFSPVQGSRTEILTMTMDMDMEMTVEGEGSRAIDMPPVEIEFEIEVEKVDSNGDIHASFYCSRTDVVAEAGTPPPLARKLQAEIEKMVGFSTSLVMDSQGRAKDINLIVPDSMDPNLRQMFEQTMNSLGDISAPMPEEAVGVGAKWRVSASPTLNGIRMNQTATYEIASIEGDRIVLDTQVEQEAEPQNMTLPGLPPNATVNLESLDGSGRGQVTMDLNKIVPIAGNVSMDSNTRMLVQISENGRADQKMLQMNTSIGMTMESE